MGSGSEICDHCFLESEGRHRLDWNGMFFLGGFVVGEMQLNCFMHYNLFHLSWSAWIWLGYVRAVKNCGFGFKILFATCPYVLPLRVHKYSLSSSCYTTLNKAKARFERHSHRGLITVIFEFFPFVLSLHFGRWVMKISRSCLKRASRSRPC